MAEFYLSRSAVKTADAIIITGECNFYGLIMATDGTNAVTLDVYDGTDATGTKIVPQMVITTSSTDRVRSISFDPPLHCETGVFVDITLGAGSCAYAAYYKATKGV